MEIYIKENYKIIFRMDMVSQSLKNNGIVDCFNKGKSMDMGNNLKINQNSLQNMIKIKKFLNLSLQEITNINKLQKLLK